MSQWCKEASAKVIRISYSLPRTTEKENTKTILTVFDMFVGTKLKLIIIKKQIFICMLNVKNISHEFKLVERYVALKYKQNCILCYFFLLQAERNA